MMDENNCALFIEFDRFNNYQQRFIAVFKDSMARQKRQKGDEYDEEVRAPKRDHLSLT